jgi:hypothetical protein
MATPAGPRRSGARAITHLLTWHGNVLCRQRDDSVVVQRPLTGPFEDVDLLSLGDMDRVLQVNLLNLLRDDVEKLSLTLTEGPMAGWAFTRAPDRRSLLLSHTGRVLVARPDLSMDLTRGTIDSTSCFLAITTADLGALRDIVTSRWLVQSDEPPHPTRAEIAPGFMLRVGALEVDLRWNVPFDLSEFPHRLTALRDGWRIDRLFRYRPLVFYAAFGNEAIEQLSISLNSLMGPGGYTGDVAVLTDHDTNSIRALKPAGMAGTIVVIRCDASDAVAQRAARLAIAGWRDGWTFQPLLFVDTEVLFDRPIGPLLQNLAMADRIAAPAAPAGAVGSTPGFGGDLLREEAWDPNEIEGVNTAVLGIPNLGQHAHRLELIGRILRNRASLFGRNGPAEGEQAAANYVSFRLADFDTSLITPHLRDAGVAPTEAEPVGMVHFGAIAAGTERLALMRDYLMQHGGSRPGDTVSPDDVAAYSMNPVLDFETIMQSLQR